MTTLISEKSYIVREGTRSLFDAELELPQDQMPAEELFLLMTSEHAVTSCRVSEVHPGLQEVVYLPRSQREALDVEAGETIQVQLLLGSETPVAEVVNLAISSSLFGAYQQADLQRELRRVLTEQPVRVGETKTVPFNLNPTSPEAQVVILSIVPEVPLSVIKSQTKLLIQPKPYSQMIIEARDLSQAVFKGGPKAWEKNKRLLNCLEELGQAVDETTHENQDLKEQIGQLSSPALMHCVLIGPSREEGAEADEYEVGVQGARLTVKAATHLKDKPDLSLENLQEGREVLLNAHQNIVGVLDENIRGVVAEVVNLIIDQEGQPPNRLQVRYGGNDLVVECGSALDRRNIEIGDLVRIDAGIMRALEKIRHHETGELQLEEIPNVTYEDIGGLDLEIEKIKDTIALPYLHAELFKRFKLERPKGLLLYGPPGCGKTMIAKAIANDLTSQIKNYLNDRDKALETIGRELEHINLPVEPKKDIVLDKSDLSALNQAVAACLHQENAAIIQRIIQEMTNQSSLSRESIRGWIQEERKTLQTVIREGRIKSYFLNIKGPELLTKWVGDTELKIRKVFEMAKKNASFYTPVVLFFDEMEALFRKRGSGISSDIEMTIVPQFLSEMDGVEEYSNVIVVGATNRHELLDPAVTRAGRLDIKIYINRPKEDQARQIFRKNFYPWPNEPHQPLPLRQDELAKYQTPEMMIKDLIEDAIGVIYNQKNLVRVTTKKGKEIIHPISEFISGALIHAIISRASQYAIKAAIGEHSEQAGISKEIFKTALIDEYSMNKDYFIENLPELEGESFDVDLEFHPDVAYNKWREPRLIPFFQRVN